MCLECSLASVVYLTSNTLIELKGNSYVDKVARTQTKSVHVSLMR